MQDNMKNKVVTIVFMITIVMTLIINIIKKDTEISITERRKLATFPSLSIGGFFDDSIINQFEKYTMDQFIKRDEFRKLKTFIEFKIFRKMDVNDVYEYNGTIVKQEYPLNEKSVQNIVDKINIIKEQYLNENNNIYYSIVPDKNYFVDSQYLKMDYSKIEQIMDEGLKNIEYINIFDCLELEDYYYTDTHWKQEKLGKVLEKISTKMKFKDRIISPFEEKEITKFNGVYSRQLQVKTGEDTIKVLTNNIINNSKTYNVETQKEAGIYNLDKIKSNDRYDIYLSGATSLITIENPNATTDKELIVFRDSFGSSLVPLFTEAYKRITAVDTRYMASKYLSNYIDFSDKDVLFLYSTLVINSSYILK